MAFLQPGLRGGNTRWIQVPKEQGLETEDFLEVSPHENHGPEDEAMKARAVICRMSEAVEADLSRPARRVYNACVQDEQQLEDVPNFGTVRTQLERRRAAHVPPIPCDIENVVIPGEWAETWGRGRQFLSHQDNDWGIMVFATNKNYRKLRECKVMYMDGTFKTCPRPYSQFFTIHGLYQGRVLPLVMVLMADKRIGAYRQVFQHVRAKVQQLTGHRLHLQRVVADYEISLMTVIDTEFRRTRISSCYFHFCQSLWRRIQRLGMARMYRQDQRLKKCIRMLMGIGYLPVAVVRMNFQNFVRRQSTQRLIVLYPALEDFIHYMETNYINANVTFPVHLWNVFNRDQDTRTDNHVEGFHTRWNNNVGRVHPSLWFFIRKMKDEQRLVEMTLAGIAR
ncbi:uncharacterized protein LOC100377344 [Saccoglossus kowalevskii]|uniref:Uncharacterized protein LOC100377344 n=1 Tax=Saccoglossus kowalevskii TaxID=10224 RepID=A0ABM0GXI8_SACKO|nr:PREDICTED: uncharacterized protein LOC100377344 [Saccoglossus kowalevskii]